MQHDIKHIWTIHDNLYKNTPVFSDDFADINVTEIFVKLSLKLMLLKNHEKIGTQQSFSIGPIK